MSNITYAHPSCFYCQGWASEAETEANRRPDAEAAQVGDDHHWARYYKDLTQAPTHGAARHESETEMNEHLHYITHTHDTGYGIKTRFTCTGDRTSPCHQYPPEGAEVETWGEADRALFVPHDECWMKSWMEDAGCAETCCPDGEPVRSGLITVTWNGDCLEWEYVEEATS